MMLKGKNALVTGASRGIGKAIALELGSKGVHIAVNFAGNEAKAQEGVDELKKMGDNALKVQADVSDESQVKDTVETVLKCVGSLDILVINAGITQDSLDLRMTAAEFARVIDTNLPGAFLCMKTVARQMMRQKSGRIINVASIVGVSGSPGQG